MVKFSHSLQLNAFPEWVPFYLAYSNLKKSIYGLEREAYLEEARTPNDRSELDTEAVPLTIGESATTDFMEALDHELHKIVAFFEVKNGALADAVREISQGVDVIVEGSPKDSVAPPPPALIDISIESNLGESDAGTRPGSPSRLARTVSGPASGTSPQKYNSHTGFTGDSNHPRALSESNVVPIYSSHRGASESCSVLTKKLIETFIELSNLLEYISLNQTGFSKILKKYEKVTGQPLRTSYMAKVNAAPPFLDASREDLQQRTEDVIRMYALLATHGNKALAEQQLLANVHERVVFYRNTIWKDMIEVERKKESIQVRPGSVADSGEVGAFITWTKLSLGQSRTLHVPLLPKAFWLFCLGLAVFLTIILVPVFPSPEQNNCFAILVFASYLWALEVLPLFVTALFVPLLVVILRVLCNTAIDASGHEYCVRMTSKEAAKKIFSDMFGPVIMLLLGGFSLAAALSKHNIAKSLAGAVLGRAGNNPASVILTNMFVSTFASMWISNVAAPVLCFSLISPILRNQPPKSTYAKALIMGIAMAANVGGMASPISSPQNVVAMGNMHPPPSWFQWFAVSIPVCIVLDLLIWGVLLAVYRPEQGASVPEIQYHSHLTKFNGTQYFVIGISVLTIALWCVESSIEVFIGDMGVIAILPILAFYSTGILKKDDWNSMLWSVVVLAMGGISLGKAVESSGLLKVITDHIAPYLSTLSTFHCLVLFSGIVLVITSFISHTVGALIILPVVEQVGMSIPGEPARIMVMAACIMCSGAMGLPVSSFPNMNAISLEGPTGVPWLSVVDFMKIGLIASVLALVTVLVIGYPLMLLVGKKNDEAPNTMSVY